MGTVHSETDHCTDQRPDSKRFSSKRFSLKTSFIFNFISGEIDFTYMYEFNVCRYVLYVGFVLSQIGNKNIFSSAERFLTTFIDAFHVDSMDCGRARTRRWSQHSELLCRSGSA